VRRRDHDQMRLPILRASCTRGAQRVSFRSRAQRRAVSFLTPNNPASTPRHVQLSGLAVPALSIALPSNDHRLGCYRQLHLAGAAAEPTLMGSPYEGAGITVLAAASAPRNHSDFLGSGRRRSPAAFRMQRLPDQQPVVCTVITRRRLDYGTALPVQPVSHRWCLDPQTARRVVAASSCMAEHNLTSRVPTPQLRNHGTLTGSSTSGNGETSRCT